MRDVAPPERVLARFNSWTLLRDPLELLKEGEPVRVQELPLKILEVLASQPGQLVTREELVKRLWPGGVVDFDAGLNTAMRKLRAVLGDDSDSPRYIETIPRQGYRFVGGLETAQSPDRPEPLPAAAAAPISAGGRSHRAWVLTACALAAALILACAFFVLPRATPEQQSATAHIRMAILPFENLSPDPANAFFTEGMHAEISRALASSAPGIDVVSRVTMKSYKVPPDGLQQMARDLRVTHVLEASVFRDDARVRITATLSDARTDRQVWARSFEKDLQSAITLQSAIASEVVHLLAIELPEKTGLPPPRNLKAYDMWLKGTVEWQSAVNVLGVSEEELLRIEDLYTKAIELDPEFAAAYAERARVRTFKFITGYDVGVDNVEAARGDIATARRLAGDAPLVLMRNASLTSVVDHDVKKSLELIARAESVGPLDADLLMFKGGVLAGAGRVEESVQTYADAARRDPANPLVAAFLQAGLFTSHRPEEALRISKDFDRRLPGRISRGELLFFATASTTRWRQELDLLRAAQPLAALSMENDLLRFEGRLDAARELLERTQERLFRQHFTIGPIAGLPARPVAELRGWHALLTGDDARASREGAEIIRFVGAADPARWNKWWLRLLEAEGSVFRKDRLRARSSAEEAIRLVEEIPTASVRMFARTLGARILAWSGAQDQALDILEGLSGGLPALGPAAITRDPLFAVPLHNSARYARLKQKLELEIARNQSLLVLDADGDASFPTSRFPK